ncbi:hypothetical protein HMPREF1119_1825 [Haemophilus parainfluenzae HK2019]|uniref:Uncharacterized protein n=1 Tax=Haemophilus parainfluenzae HK2019 TaxID=1095746 RepID=A0ABN0EVI7_HAEPA|nr:hypothetical protein HMPREF1119_1825 [Haemophilus parainfluenzae HK2019]
MILRRSPSDVCSIADITKFTYHIYNKGWKIQPEKIILFLTAL